MISLDKQLINKLKIAIVHDDFIQKGGAESLIFEIIKEFNSRGFSPVVYSSIISPGWKNKFDKEKILYKESFLKFFPWGYKYSKIFFFLDLFSLSFQSFNFDEFDIVFSSSTRFGHSIVTKPGTFHISYVNSPSRVVWFPKDYFTKNKFLLFLIKRFINFERIKDYRSQFYSDLVLTNSKNIYKKFYKIYKRNSLVLNPFIYRPNNIKLKSQKDYYILISRLVPWKRIDFVIEAFNQSGSVLYVIGDGPTKNKLKNISRENIKFYGYIDNELKSSLLSQAKALIFPQDEDFGLTIIEALSFGIPIIYFNKGGAKEILNHEFGTPFLEQTAESLIGAISTNKSKIFKRESLIEHSETYSKDKFFRVLERIILNKFKLKI